MLRMDSLDNAEYASVKDESQAFCFDCGHRCDVFEPVTQPDSIIAS